jgi:putative FmdB family regulatory protein
VGAAIRNIGRAASGAGNHDAREGRMSYNICFLIKRFSTHRADSPRLVMPIYEYRCSSCGHKLESLQKFSDAPLVACPACHADALVKQVSAAGFHLKGSGWYATDFKGSGAKPAAKSGDGDAKPAEGTADAKSDAKADAKPDAKSDAKAETKSDSKPAATPGTTPAATT